MAGIGVPVTVLTLRAGFQGQKKPRVGAEARMVDWSPTLAQVQMTPALRVFQFSLPQAWLTEEPQGSWGKPD